MTPAAGAAPGAVAVIGDVLIDVVVRPTGRRARTSDTPSTITWRQGGAATTTAVWLARLGVDVRLLGRVGDDLAGQALHERLRADGVHPLLVTDLDHPTGTVVAMVVGDDRDMYTGRGASGRLLPEDLPTGWLDGVAHLHLSGYVLLDAGTRAAGLAALGAAARAGVGVSVDPSSAGPLSSLPPGTFAGWLPAGALVTPNSDEARVLTGLADPAAAARRLAAEVGEAVVTCAADGAVWSDGDRTVRQPSVPVAGAVVDPVGAGDAFTAGLLASRVAGAPIELQLARAVDVAARAVVGHEL